MEYIPCEDPECYSFWENGDADYIAQLEDDRAMERYFLQSQEDAFNNYFETI